MSVHQEVINGGEHRNRGIEERTVQILLAGNIKSQVQKPTQKDQGGQKAGCKPINMISL